MSSRFDWGGFLALAEELALRQDEASKRTAISRAYYCVFHHALVLVESESMAIPKTGAAHDAVWDILMKAGGRRRQIGDSGRGLRTMRRIADYEPVLWRLDWTTATALVQARWAMKLLDVEFRG